MERKSEKEKEGEGRKNLQKINLQLCEELLRAAEQGETERVRELLRMEGVDVHYAEGEDWVGWKKTALCAACAGGHLETACVILEHRGQTQKELEDAFVAAVRE